MCDLLDKYPEFIFTAGEGLSAEYLDPQAAMQHRPLITADLTRGMPQK